MKSAIKTRLKKIESEIKAQHPTIPVLTVFFVDERLLPKCPFSGCPRHLQLRQEQQTGLIWVIGEGCIMCDNHRLQEQQAKKAEDIESSVSL